MNEKPYWQISSGMAGVDLWSMDLARPIETRWLVDLSPLERERAALLQRPIARRRFLATRSAVRRLLAEYRREDPGALQLTEDVAGKPALPGGPCFNVSHAEDLAVCAVAVDRRVGVDLERLRPIPGAERILRRWFSPADLRAWTSARPEQRAHAFLRPWTRREAYLKALGVGLAGLDDVGRIDPRRWELRDLSPAEGYVGALVAERSGGSAG